MKLRKLERKDAPFMLEWMHDPAVVENMRTDFAQKTIEDCEAFIDASQNKKGDIHLAITDDSDEYMGTVSLKNVAVSEAEFAIAVRRPAMGQGYAQYGMKEIIRHGLDDLGLASVYWCVSPENKRAVRFYDKNGYHKVEPLKSRGGTRQSRVGITSGTRCGGRRAGRNLTTKYRNGSFLVLQTKEVDI